MCKKHLRIGRAMSLSAILFTLCFQFISVSNASAQWGCNSNVQVSIDGVSCEAVITPDVVLEGSVPAGAELSIDGGPRVPSAIVTEKGTYTVTVYESSASNANSCWGTITVEDKVAPEINGITSETACNAVDFATDFALGGPTVTLDLEVDDCRDLASYFVAGPLPATGSVILPYTVISITIPVDGSYTFTPQNGAACNYVFNLYPQNGFDPMNPCSTTNLVAFGGLSTISGISQTGAACLDKGKYDLVICSLDPTCADVIRQECSHSCNDLEGILAGEIFTGVPVVTECNDYDCIYSDATVLDQCNGTVVTRTWICTDDCGNVSDPYQEVITLDPVDLNEVLAPDPTVFTSCGVATDPQSIYDYLIDNGFSEIKAVTSAWPTYFGKPISDPTLCNVAASYTDQVVPTCGAGCDGNVKVIRTWSLFDWCPGGSTTPSIYVQIIKAEDNEGPTITFNQTTYTVSVNPWNCDGTFQAPSPDILHDNCDFNPDYTISGPLGSVVNGSTVSGLGLGTHVLTYTATDCCDNPTTATVTVNVVDETPPVAVAIQNIVVSLTNNGTEGSAKLFNTSVDNGSHDGCGGVHLEIRRESDNCNVQGNTTYNNDGHTFDGHHNPNNPNYDPDDGEFVKFCCDDVYGSNGVDEDGDGINDYGTVKVWLRVFDDNGNFNETWTYVRVEDKLAPYLVCPPDLVIDCDDDPDNLDITGSAEAYSACGNREVGYTDSNNINNCNYGVITRKWFVVGRPDIFCVQNIQILPGDPFDGDDIVWPQDVDTDCTNLGFTGIPLYATGACDMVAYSMESDTFLFESGACLKILNQFTVVDWCQYDPNDPLSDGIWHHTQVIKVNDDEKPVITCQDEMFEVNDHLDTDGDGNICEGVGLMLTNTAMDNGACASDWLKWEISLDIWGNGVYEYVYSSNLPSTHPFYVGPTSNGGEVKINLPDIDGSMANHKVIWQVTDGCGNTVSCTQYFMVVDKKAPIPYCVNISTALMDNGTVDLWAIDFDLGATDNCSDQDKLRFTFTDALPQNDPNFVPSLSSSTQTFDCDDIPSTPGEQLPLNVYVWDEKDNYSFCTVYLTLIDNNNSCGTGTLVAPIAGRVATEDGEEIEDVNMELATDAIVSFPINQMTNSTGDYAFYNNPMYLDYELNGSKVDEYMNGVSTLDLLLIQKHLLNIQPFNSPYKVIASDVNNDSNISAIDLIELRKLILGIYVELPANDSWRIVDAAQTWNNIASPFPFNEVVHVTNLTTSMMAEDFVGVKIGDVNGNASVNVSSNDVENRSGGTFEMSIEDQQFEAGQLITVEFKAEDLTSLSGYQFTLNSQNLDFVGVESDRLDMNQNNVAVSKDAVAVSWANANDIDVDANEVLFTMTFTATTYGKLSESINLSDMITVSEAYVDDASSIVDLAVNFRNDDDTIASPYALYQNEPNPFSQTTSIGFNLPKAADASLNIFDVTGKLIKTIDRSFEKGFNQISLEKSDLPVTGIVYYQLESGAFSATKKMIIVE